MAGGRPTVYCQDMVDKARDYCDNYADHGDRIPSHAGLSLALEVSRTTVYAWAKEEGKEEFSDILEKILAKQEQLLISNGLSGDFNAAITKLVLGKHGYHEKQDTTHSAPDGGPIKTSTSINFIPVGSK